MPPSRAVPDQNKELAKSKVEPFVFGSIQGELDNIVCQHTSVSSADSLCCTEAALNVLNTQPPGRLLIKRLQEEIPLKKSITENPLVSLQLFFYEGVVQTSEHFLLLIIHLEKIDSVPLGQLGALSSCSGNHNSTCGQTLSKTALLC